MTAPILLRPPSAFRALLGALVVLAASRADAAGRVDHFADNGYGNPVSTMQHPAAEHFNGITYVAYQGPHEDPFVAAYVHSTDQWIGPVQVGVNPLGKSPDQVDPGELDNHGRPALIVDRLGYIHVVFGAHGGDPSFGDNKFGTPGRGRMIHVVSQEPGDITAWQTLDNLSPFGTYTQWVKRDNGDLYLFYRHGSHRSDWVYQKSVDHGRTFSAQVSVLKHKASAGMLTVYDAWYAWFENGQGDTITASYVYHPCALLGHTSHRNNTYFMQFDGSDGAWRNVQGVPLKLPVTKEAADKLTLIEATGDVKTNHGTCRVDAEGRPHLYFRFPQGELRYYRWLGHAWQKAVVVADANGIGGDDGDLVVDSPMEVRMLMSYKQDGIGSIGWWNSSDGGLTWTRGATLHSLTGASLDATTLVRNAHPDARMLVADKRDAASHLYRNMYLLGDRGPLGRPAAEASHLGDRLETIKLMPQTRAKADAKKKKKAGLMDE